MKKLLLLLAAPLLLVSCIKDNQDEEQNKTVSLDLDLSLSFNLERTGEANKGVGLTNKFSEFEHIFKDEVDLVFTSTTTTFSTTLTITPNDLSNTPTLVIPYGTYSWSISDNEQDGTVDYFLRSYLPIYGSGSVEIFSSSISIDLLVDTNFGLVTVEKENISSAKISLGGWEKDLALLNNYYYIYALQSDGYSLSINENKYNTTITTYIDTPNMLYSKTHYNYKLVFSDVDVNSIILKSTPFTQYDFYLQPESTGTSSSTCLLTLSPYQSQNILTQTVSATNAIQAVTFSTSTTCSETINYSVSGLPTGVSMDIIEQTFPRISGTVSSSVVSGTYNYTITAFNSTLSSTATVSATATGTIIVSNTNSDTSQTVALDNNRGITVDSNNNVYVSEYDGLIKKINTAKQVTIFAGSEQSGDEIGDVQTARFTNPIAMDFDSNGNLFISDHNNDKIKKIGTDSSVTNFASIDRPNGIYIDDSNSLFVCEAGGHKIKKIDSNGNISLVIGSSQGNFNGIGDNAQITSPQSISMDSNGYLYFTTQNQIKKIDLSNNQLSTFHSVNSGSNFALRGLAIDSNDNIFVSVNDNENDLHQILKISQNGIQTILAGSSNGFKDGLGNQAKFGGAIWHMNFDSEGNLLVSDQNNGAIRKIETNGNVTTL
ncbi:MAG: hypothetical protein P8O88_04565 [Flavobacteriaceae bacterium]|nr:hypothetical protein [Flavobacteriaceae bacterium]